MPRSSLKTTESKHTRGQSSWCSIINSFAGEVHLQLCQPAPVPPARAHCQAPTRQPQGHRLPGPNHRPPVVVPRPPPLSQGCTWASWEPDMGFCRQHQLIAKRNPTDSQGGFQIPSATSPIQIQLCLPTQVSKMHTEMQKGILFPANNYPLSLQPPLPTLKYHKCW